jgi:hydrophobic/amphiphilic exporter-1 (mainly G- bacteria), HAE1 family
MNISKTFIEKPIMTILLFSCLVIFGITAYFKSPVSDMPSVNFPVLIVETKYPGANAETVANTVTSPIEKECMNVQGLDEITSSSTEGLSVIQLLFPAGENANDYIPKLQQALARAATNLPELPDPPLILEQNPATKPVMFIVVESDLLTEGDLYDIAYNKIAEKISIIKGVSIVDISGNKFAVRIKLNPVKLANYNLDPTDIAKILNEASIIKADGSLDGNTTYSLETINSQLTDAKDYNKIIIKYVDDTPLRIENVGTAYNATENDVFRSMLYKYKKPGNKNPIFIKVIPTDDANNIDVANKIKKMLRESKNELQESINVFIANDRSIQIVDAIDDITFSLFLAFIFTVFAIFLFLGKVMDTIIPTLALIPAFICIFLGIYFAEYSVNILTLMAIILAIGFIIDDSIVVYENSYRLAQEGYTPKEASRQSAKDLTITVISTSVALIVVFLPIFFMGGVTGLSLREFAGTVIIAIISSTIIALSLLPMLCSLLIKNNKDKKESFFQKCCNSWVKNLTNYYSKALRVVLKYKFVSLLVWILCIIGIIFLFSMVQKEFIPVGDSSVIKGCLVTPIGTSTKEMRKYQDSIDNVIKKDSNIEHFITITGETQGADQSKGSIFLFTKPEKERKSIQKVTENLRHQIKKESTPIGITYLAPIPFVSLPVINNTAIGADYSFLIVGADVSKVNECAEEFEKKLIGMPQFNSVQNSVKSDMPKIKIRLLRDKIYANNITADNVLNAISNSFAQKDVAMFTTETDQHDVYIEVENNFRGDVKDLGNIYIRSIKTNLLVPLLAIAQIEQTVGEQEIIHYNKQYAAVISFNLSAGASIGDATNIINTISEEILPPGIKGTLEGVAKQFSDSAASLKALIIISVFLLYIILGMLYESFIHPITILTTLPLAAFGALLSLIVCSSQLSLYAYIGMFLLLGNIAKNGIILIDFANQMFKEKNMNSYDAIFNACTTRFRPILMTSLTTIMAAVPFAIGVGFDADSRRPLGIVIVGGYLFGTAITLFVTPGIFLYMQKLQEKIFDRFEFSRSKIKGKTDKNSKIKKSDINLDDKIKKKD